MNYKYRVVVIVLALAVLVSGLVILLNSRHGSVSAVKTQNTVSPVSYQEAVRQAVGIIEKVKKESADVAVYKNAATNTDARLLALVVPASSKDLHFLMVTTLERYENAVAKTDTESAEAALAAWRQIGANEPWTGIAP